MLTKLKRWATFSDSTRPASQTKASRDLNDIVIIVQCLHGKKMRIDFAGYPEKPKSELLLGVRKLYAKEVHVRDLLKVCMEEEDFIQVKT